MGLPVPGLEFKLTPVGGKREARVKGPNVTPGYWGDEALTRAAFDEEGYYKTGDAMEFVDPADPGKGLVFDGRLAEDFKLSTGTWVSVGPLRARIVAQGRGLVQDVVIAGHDRNFASALVFPNLGGAATPPASAPTCRPPRWWRIPRSASDSSELFDALAAESTGSSHVRAARGDSRRAAVARRQGNHRQGVDQPEGRPAAPRRDGRRPLRAIRLRNACSM